jgi:hypothetical protein
MSTSQVFQQQEGIQVAGDATIGTVNLYNQRRPYTDLKPDDLLSADGRLISPGAKQLIRQVADLRLLVLAPVELDGPAIACQLAAGLYTELRNLGNRDLKIRDWSADGGLIDLDTLLDGQETKILIFSGAGPNNLGVGLDRLARLLAERQHYAIITTELDLDLWHPNSSERRFCSRPSWDSYYGPEFLCDLLRQELKLFTSRSASGGEDAKAAAGGADTLLAGVQPEWIVAKLREPDRLFDFVKALEREPGPVSKECIEVLTDEESGDRSKAVRWYRDQVERLQLLAVGLMLFEGLPADQVFAGLETLVDGVWRPDHPALQGFDYLDVERLGRYFKRLQDAGEEGRIVITAQREIFDAAWQLHRRSILAALPAMAAMLRNAGMGLEALALDPAAAATAGTVPQGAAPGPSTSPLPETAAAQKMVQGQNTQPSGGEAVDRRLVWGMAQGRARELYGSARRMAGLQSAAVASLSMVGQISRSAFAAVEPCLRELAADESELVRAVVGRALAATRDWAGRADEEPPLFGLLRDWWRDSCSSQEARRRDSKEASATRATVALAVGHAANYDPPNQMNPRLIGLLQSAIQDRWPEMRRALRQVLPWILARHLGQLEEQALVRGRIAAEEDLVVSAALGVAHAYRLHPQETGEILGRWSALASGTSDAAAAGQVADQELLLALTARSLGALRAGADDPVFPPSRIFAELSAFLAVARNPLVIRHILIAAGEQALRFYELAAPLVVKLLAEVSLRDRSLLVGIFVRAYLEQRRKLAGGDETLQIGEERYPIWIWQGRPLTQVEEVAYLWLQEWEHPAAQQVAAETFAALGATTLESRERQLIAERRAPAGGSHRASSSLAPAPSPNRVRSLGVLGWLALVLTVRGRELRAALWAPFAELVWISRQAPSTTMSAAASPAGSHSYIMFGLALASTTEVLQRWRIAAANESLKDLVDHMQRALTMYRWRWPIVLTSTALALVLGWSILLIGLAQGLNHR